MYTDKNSQFYSNWTAYLNEFRQYIEKGYQFTRLAVQEPFGVMILKASYGMKHRFANVTGIMNDFPKDSLISFHKSSS